MTKRPTNHVRSSRPLTVRQLVSVRGGADLESAGEELKSAIKAFWSPQLGNSLTSTEVTTHIDMVGT